MLELGKYHHQVLEKAWQLVRESSEERDEFQLMQKAVLMEMLVYILRGLNEDHINVVPYLSKSQRRQQQIVNYTVYYLENHYKEEITLEKLAQDQFLSPTYLSKIFKEATGVSPINYLIEIRLKRAKDMLKNDNLTIKEVASAVGYQDAYHFSKSFKKLYGRLSFWGVAKTKKLKSKPMILHSKKNHRLAFIFYSLNKIVHKKTGNIEIDQNTGQITEGRNKRTARHCRIKPKLIH